MSGLAAVVGGVIAYFALSAVSDWIPEILAFAAASMIYVAVADLIPGLHKRTGARDSLIQVIFIALGIGSIWLIHAVLFPESLTFEPHSMRRNRHRTPRRRATRRASCASAHEQVLRVDGRRGRRRSR